MTLTPKKYIRWVWGQAGVQAFGGLGDMLVARNEPFLRSIEPAGRYRFEILRELGGIIATTGIALFYSPSGKAPEECRLACASQCFQIAGNIRVILKLLEAGKDVQARIIARSCVESLDLLGICAEYHEVAKEFIECESPEDANKFWRSHISFNKGWKKVKSFVDGILEGVDIKATDGEEDVGRVEFFDWRQAESAAMAWAAHPSHMSGMATFFEFDDEARIIGSGFERGWKSYSSRVLDYLITSIFMGWCGMELAARKNYGGLDGFVRLPRGMARPTARRVKAALAAGPAVILLCDWRVLEADDIETTIQDRMERLRLVKRAPQGE